MPALPRGKRLIALAMVVSVVCCVCLITFFLEDTHQAGEFNRAHPPAPHIYEPDRLYSNNNKDNDLSSDSNSYVTTIVDLQSVGAATHNVTPSRILYNKVPKCGSRTVTRVLKAACEQNKVQMVNEFVPMGFALSPKQEKEFVIKFQKLHMGTVFSRHLSMPNFTRYGYEFPGMINLVRDPVSHVASNYYYQRGEQYFLKRMDKETARMSLDECVSRNHSSCMQQDGIIPFMCGQSDVCRTKSAESVRIAKHNIIHHYGAVGYLEDVRSFLEVLEKLYPQYFTGAVRVYDQKAEKYHKGTKTRKRKEPEETTVAALRKHLRYDYELYDFIVENFKSQYRSIVL